MDTDTLVENQIDDAQRFLAKLVGSGFDVTAACWARTSEEDRWFFYIATKAIEEKGLAAAYGDAYGVLLAMDNPWISVSEVKLIPPTNPMVRDLLDIQRRSVSRMPMHTRRSHLGSLGIEEAYIFPHFERHQTLPKEERRLKIDVVQLPRPEELSQRFTPEEEGMQASLLSQGVDGKVAEYLIQRRREALHPKHPIPAGTVVKVWPVSGGEWGIQHFEDDPNPLVMVESPDGARGLTHKSNTEPITE